MPNGGYHAQCHNCASFAYRKSGRCCRKHDFHMPRVSAEVLCRDWRVREKERRDKPWAYGFADTLVASAGFQALQGGVLYYYHYFSDAPPEPLGSFGALQTPVWSVRIRQDPVYGWALYPAAADYDLLPPPGASLRVRLNGAAHRFDIDVAQRPHVEGGSRTPSGSWETRWATREERILHCPAAPAALYRWLDVQLDTEGYVARFRDHEFGEQVLDAGFHAFIQTLETRLEYRLLQLDRVSYGEFLRQ